MSGENREDIALKESSLLRRASQRQLNSQTDILPDLHGIRTSAIYTELETSDARSIHQAVSSATNKPALRTANMRRPSSATTRPMESIESKLGEDELYMAGAFYPPPRSRIPDGFRTGWTSFSNAENPGGSLPIPSTYKRADVLDEVLPDFAYGEWYHNAAALVATAFVAFCLGKIDASLGSIILFCLAMGTYYQTSMRRFRHNARDDIQRELSKIHLETEEEPVEWMNSILQKFWLIFEPVLSALVVENLDNYIAEYLPSYLESIRLSTFTLGTKPFRIESVRTHSNTDSDTVCMDWRVSFTPNDLTDLNPEQLDDKVNPRVTLLARVGKGAVGAWFPVLLEDMTFSGLMRIKIKFTSRLPYAKIIEASFLEKPVFDYVLKPLGRDSFGFDVNVIPGLQSFITYEVHGILGPLMYAPNVFTFDVEKFMAGEFDISQANGVLALTIYSCRFEKMEDILLHPEHKLYLRFYLDHGQELGRTGLCKDVYEPRWDETQFLLLNNLNAQLSIELRAQIPNAKDRRLATANFDLRHLDDENYQALEGSDMLMLRNGKQVCDLGTDLRYLPVLKPFKRPDGTIEPAPESNSGVLRLIVHECQLDKRRNVYCRVLVNGIERLVTRTVKRNDSPTFEDAGEAVILDKSNVYVRVELRGTKEKHGDEPLFGYWSSSLADLMNQQEENDAWWNMSLEDGPAAGRVRFSAQWKPVNMLGLAESLGSHGFESPVIGVVRFEFLQAKDLRNVEMMGKSDPYVRVMSGNHARAHTEVVDNNLDPEWGEVHFIPVHVTESKLKLEVMDWNRTTNDRSLGVTDVKLVDLMRQCVGKQNVDPDIWYESTGEQMSQRAPLRSTNRSSDKGTLQYTATFYPVLALPASVTLPAQDLHGSYIKYTPDDLVDLSSYSSGVLKVKIYNVELYDSVHAFCVIKLDSVMPQYRTSSLHGRNLPFDETADMFVRDLSLSQISIELKPYSYSEKNDRVLDRWTGGVIDIVRLIQSQRRAQRTITNAVEDGEEGADHEPHAELFHLRRGLGTIQLGFDYAPMADFTLHRDESPNNQGLLTVHLRRANDLKGVDKSGTSDPYVEFWVNGELVYTSEVISKQLNPVWSKKEDPGSAKKSASFKLPIISRATTSLRVDVYDWNKVKDRKLLGSCGLSLREIPLNYKTPYEATIPLDGVEKVSGTVTVEFEWKPQAMYKKAPTGTTATDRMTERKSTDLGIVPLASRSTSSLVSDGTNSSWSNVRRSVDSMSLATTMTESTMNEISETVGKEGKIIIHVQKARDLFAADKSGTSDPVVYAKLGKQKVGKTKVVMKTLEPVWDHEFMPFAVSDKPTILQLKVMDWNRLHSQVELGRCRRNIWDLVTPGERDVYEGWLALSDAKDPSKGGEIYVRMEYDA